eukprot:m.17282 g.17282  ORF g.17282 m.17282 type:complete len:394 (+) comp27418_c0_seq2:144-1325(+)
MNFPERDTLLRKLKERNQLQVTRFFKMQAEEVASALKEGLVEPNDFRLQCNQFLDKMKHSSSFELVKSIKKFISNFAKDSHKPLPTEQRVAEVRQFLEETSAAISRHNLWRGLGADELDIATEGLERYVMHKVHEVAYCPPREDDQRKDCEFAYKVRSLGFVTAQHLDVWFGQYTDLALKMASGELQQMSSYKSPRDKVTAVMNCCTVICNLLKDGSKGHTRGADDILPLLILVLIRTKPSTWWSDFRYIQRYRNPSKLSSEEGYYLTQMSGAVQFIEKANAHSFNDMTEEEFIRLSSMSLNRTSPPPASLLTDSIDGNKQKEAAETPEQSLASSEVTTPLEKTTVDNFPALAVVTTTFLECQFEDLTVGELRQMFEEYKSLARFFQSQTRKT